MELISFDFLGIFLLQMKDMSEMTAVKEQKMYFRTIAQQFNKKLRDHLELYFKTQVIY